MKIKYIAVEWPPQTASRSTKLVDAEMDDVVFTAARHVAAKVHVRLKLRKKHGIEYTAVQPLPFDEAIEFFRSRSTSPRFSFAR